MDGESIAPADRAADLIDKLGLRPHPEGGYFREVYRSAARVQPLDGRTGRLALTTIYFLLVAGQVSRWHRVASDEVWHYYEGGRLELLAADAGLNDVSRRVLGPVGDNTAPVHVVLAGEWQAAVRWTPGLIDCNGIIEVFRARTSRNVDTPHRFRHRHRPGLIFPVDDPPGTFARTPR